MAGVVIQSCSGAFKISLPTISTARRVRRVSRAFLALGGWSGWRTMEELAEFAANRPGRKASAIAQEFLAIGKARRATEDAQ